MHEAHTLCIKLVKTRPMAKSVSGVFLQRNSSSRSCLTCFVCLGTGTDPIRLIASHLTSISRHSSYLCLLTCALAHYV